MKSTCGEIIINPEKVKPHKISLVSQRIRLIDGTVRENVNFGLKEEKLSDKLIWKLLDLVQLKSTVEALPLRLDQKIGEDAKELSGGQKQRLGIANALNRPFDLLILDEATNALDRETEENFSTD